MKITVENETYFPTLGILAQKGDEVDIPEGDAFAPRSVTGNMTNKKKSETVPVGTMNEGVVNDGSAPQ